MWLAALLFCDQCVWPVHCISDLDGVAISTIASLIKGAEGVAISTIVSVI